MAHLDRVRRLVDLQESDAVERALLDGDIVAYEPHQTAADGVNSTFYVEIEPDLVAFHKPHEGIVHGSRATTGIPWTPRQSVNARRGNSPSTSVGHTTGSSP